MGLKTDYTQYIQRYLNDINHVLWSVATIEKYVTEAETEISRAKSIIWKRFPIDIQYGVGVYSMPALLNEITNITYRGYRVDFLMQDQLVALSPVYRTQISKPRWATMMYEGYHNLRLFPIPGENLPILSIGDEIYTDKNILSECVISAYFFTDPADPALQLPIWGERRLVKSYVLWKCFQMDGQGQDVKVGKYYKKKWENGLILLKASIDKLYASTETVYDTSAIHYPFRKARPILPPNYGPIVRY